jgi:hypothetical protein
MALKHLKPFSFSKTESVKKDKLYILIEYAGGDADTEHPQYIDLKGIKFSDYQDHLDEIETEIEKYQTLKKILSDKPDYNEVLEEYGEEIAELYESVPNDPQCDYQFKCYIDSIKLVGYDEEGNKHVAYIR